MNPRHRRSLWFTLAALPLGAGLVLAAGTTAQQSQTPQTQTPQTQTPQQAQPVQPGSGQTQQRTQPSGANYAGVFLQKLAAQLGVSVERLRAAALSAGNATIDQAVGTGDLSQDRAARMKERLQNAPLTFGSGQGGFGRCGLGGHDHGERGGRGRMDGGPRGFGHSHGAAQGTPNGASGEGTTGT